MLEEPLTTAPEEEQVNIDNSQDEININTVEETEASEDITSTEEYDKAWDNIDVDNPTFTADESTNVESQQVDLENTEAASMEEIKETMNAFMTEKPVLKFKGKDIPIDNPDELIALAQKGFLLETEMSKIKPQKKVLDIVSDIPVNVLQALSDLHKGNKKAIDYLKKEYGIQEEESGSFFDDKPAQQNESDYTPTVEPENPVLDYWNNFIKAQPKEAGIVHEVYNQLDEGFQNEVFKEQIFPAFVQSVVTGEFEKAYPLAIKEKAVNPALTWLQAYALGVKKMGSEEPKVAEPSPSVRPQTTKNVSRNVDGSAAADRIWEDDAYFKEVEKRLFS